MEILTDTTTANTAKTIISWDLDFTLASFNLPDFSILCQQALMKALVKHKQYPEILLSPESTARFCSGEAFRAVYDTKTMNLLKIGAQGQVIKGFSGWEQLQLQQIIKEYGEEPKVPISVSAPKDSSGRYKYFEDYFLNYIVAPLREITELRKTDAFLAEKSGKAILDDLYSTAEYNYDINLSTTNADIKTSTWIWPSNYGYFYPALIASPKKFIPSIPCKLIEFLSNLPSNIIPVLISNGSLSHFLSVAAALSKQHPKFFDLFSLLCTDAKKPSAKPHD